MVPWALWRLSELCHLGRSEPGLGSNRHMVCCLNKVEKKTHIYTSCKEHDVFSWGLCYIYIYIYFGFLGAVQFFREVLHEFAAVSLSMVSSGFCCNQCIREYICFVVLCWLAAFSKVFGQGCESVWPLFPMFRVQRSLG